MQLKIAHILMAVSMLLSAVVLVYVDGHDVISVDTQQALITAWCFVVIFPLLAFYFYYQSFIKIRTSDRKSKLINWITCILVFLSITLVRGYETNLFKTVFTLYAGAVLSIMVIILTCMVRTKNVVE